MDSIVEQLVLQMLEFDATPPENFAKCGRTKSGKVTPRKLCPGRIPMYADTRDWV